MARILLLEPNRMQARQFSHALESAGHEVRVAGNAQAGINQADAHKPDIIILELLLAAHSGAEFLYEFRSYNEWQQIPAIVLSRIERADVPVDDAGLAKLGIVAYLYKPRTSLQKLVSSVESALAVNHSA